VLTKTRMEHGMHSSDLQTGKAKQIEKPSVALLQRKKLLSGNVNFSLRAQATWR